MSRVEMPEKAGPTIKDYKSNSKTAKAKPAANDEPVVKSLVKGKVTKKKKSLGKRFGSLFTGADAMDVGKSITEEVIIPGIKNVIYDVADNALNTVLGAVSMGLFGEALHRKNRKYSKTNVNTPYGSISTGKAQGPRTTAKSRQRHDFDEIYFDHRYEAQDVLHRMFDIVEQYDQVSVGVFYDLIGEPSNHTDRKHGWISLGGAEVKSDREGWYLKLPPTVSLV